MRAWERVRCGLKAPWLLHRVLLGGRYSFEFDLMPMALRGMSTEKRLNLVRAGGNLARRRLHPWSMPLHMQVEITNYCNLSCPVCPTGGGLLRRTPRAMDAAIFRGLVDEVGPSLLTMALYAWGEPLLHPNLREILRAASGHTAAVLVSTNGQNLDHPEVQEALLDHPPAYLIVAVDGLTDETNALFRKGARIEPLVRGMEQLVATRRARGQAWPILHMRYMVMKHNQHELAAVEGCARKWGFDLLSLRSLSIIDASEQAHQDLVPDLAEFQAYAYAKGQRIRRKDFICMQPFWYPSVYVDGTVVGCEQDFNAQAPMGVLGRDGTFKEIWYSRRAREVRRAIRDKASTLSFCRNCPYADRGPVGDNRCSVEARPLNPQAMQAGAIR